MIHFIQHNLFGMLCVLLLVSGATFVVLATSPVHVLRNWQICTGVLVSENTIEKCVVTHKTYHPGDTIALQSSSEKLRKAGGSVSRTIECDRGADSTVAYVLNLSSGHRGTGFRVTESDLIIPTNVTNLPATCRVVIAVNYKVYFFRTITENAVSNNFVIE